MGLLPQRVPWSLAAVSRRAIRFCQSSSAPSISHRLSSPLQYPGLFPYPYKWRLQSKGNVCWRRFSPEPPPRPWLSTPSPLRASTTHSTGVSEGFWHVAPLPPPPPPPPPPC